MPKIDKALRREKKINKRKNGHQEDGRSVFLLEEIKNKKARKAHDERLKRERELEEE